MAGKVRTYNPKEVLVSLGTHAASGFAEDSFITLEKNGDGITDVIGCDGEQIRSLDPDDTWNITFAFLQESLTNAWLQNKHDQDRATGLGVFPVTIKDLRGGTLFSCEQAWVTIAAAHPFGKTAQNREWSLRTGEATLIDSTQWK
ncbi:hypothetical protein AGMMS49975_08980 [Clostridia bacterium]|nr:hypothetical protein AGMMS49975_08980 [Clostridia bacterium]